MILENAGGKSNKIELKLIIYVLYVAYLMFVLLTSRSINLMLYAHIMIIIIFSLLYFGRDFLYILISPIWLLVFPIESIVIKRYLKNFKQNIPSRTVVILAHSDWHKLQAWINPNFFVSEIRMLVKYLEKNGSDFSFYTDATINDVYKIMSNSEIREVCFYGHGTSHMFQLSTNEMLYYCDFNNRGKYGKDFIHQIHCGTSHGKSLIDYVVPEENKIKCFFFRKSITVIDIEKELKRKMA